jgi:hypothetical protein
MWERAKREGQGTVRFNYRKSKLLGNKKENRGCNMAEMQIPGGAKCG